jgi:metal-sulfur cluster biosynthetic enzyme
MSTSEETMTTKAPVETVAENAAATVTADTATASPDVPATAETGADTSSEDWRARMAAEDAEAAPTGSDETAHDHAGHDHAGHDHAGHDHAGHDHAGHDHSGHDHAGHDHGVPAAPGAVAVADAPVADAPVAWTGAKASVDDVEEAMKDVVDPELGINVVDLGLVYGVHVDDENVVTLDMTLTSAACPLTDVIEDQTRSALTTGPGGGLCNDFRINWVWLPPWGPDKITDEGRDQLRTLGFNV